MLLVERSEEGRVRVRVEWIPHFLVVGDPTLSKDLGAALNDVFAGTELTDKALEEAHDFICSWLQNRYQRYHGIDAWMDSLRVVEDRGGV